MKHRFLYCLALALVVITPDVFASEHTYPFAAIHNGREYPMIVKGAKGAILCTYSTRMSPSGHTVRLAISEDEGKTWRHIDSISSLRASMFGLQRRPTTVQTSNGTLVCSYEDAKVGDAMPKVYATRSTDNGVTWSNATAVFTGPQAPMQDFSSMAAGSEGQLVVVALSADESEPGSHVYMVRSTDHGATWLAPTRVNRKGWQGRSCECCMTSVAIAPDGTVGVAFRANRNNVRDIHVAYSVDGVSFLDPVRIQNEPWTLEGCPATGPSITFDGNSRAHITWRDYRDGATQAVVWYATTLPSSQATPGNVDLSSAVAEDSDFPAITTSSDGQTVTVIHESSNGLRTAVSTDGGTTFASRVVDELVKQNSSAHAITLSDGTAMLIWMATRDGSYDVAGIVPSITSVNIDTRYSAGAQVHNVWVEVGENDQAFAYDLSGRSIPVIVETSTSRRARPDCVGIAVLLVLSDGVAKTHILAPSY